MIIIFKSGEDSACKNLEEEDRDWKKDDFASNRALDSAAVWFKGDIYRSYEACDKDDKDDEIYGKKKIILTFLIFMYIEAKKYQTDARSCHFFMTLTFLGNFSLDILGQKNKIFFQILLRQAKGQSDKH